MDVTGKQGKKKRSIYPLEREAAAERDEVRITVLLAMADLLHTWLDRLTSNARRAAQAKGRGRWEKEEIALGQTERFFPVEGQPGLAGKHKCKTRRIVRRITNTP